MRLRVPGPPGCPAAAGLIRRPGRGQQEGEHGPADADLIGMRPAGALAGLPATIVMITPAVTMVTKRARTSPLMA